MISAILTDISQLINITLVFSTSLILTAMGGIHSERSGVVNIGLEGLMMSGAFAAAVSAYFLEQAGWGIWGAWMGLVAAALFGAFFALLHAVASVTFKADQVVSGVVINLLAAGLTVYLVKVLFEGAGETKTLHAAVFSKVSIPVLADIPYVGYAFFQAYPTTYLAILIVLFTYFLLWKTRFGLRLRSVGENPGAADTLGIHVQVIRYIGVMISGAYAGLGGATIALTTTANYSHNTISGQGFIAIASMIFGKWHPFGALGAALLFGMATGLKNFIQLFPWAKMIPTEFIFMIPYILTILVLAGAVGKATPPAALGQPYDPAKR
ncbi:ABC transporter permease [Thermicanus aegyptius]|uniref:ABC transporter permease n=1 Tax=Thermicanus aegyptius TaxID=94009 RepID=UPI0004213E64|nr:ABC transporter permease [Thermicanus aegyptius]